MSESISGLVFWTAEKLCALVPDHPTIENVEIRREYKLHWRKLLELFPFYSQCVLIPGMAVERYLLICRPTEAASLLEGARRYFLYVAFPLLSLMIPAYFFADFLLYQFDHVDPHFPTAPMPS